MTKIDFYILRETRTNERLRTACRITEKAYLRGHLVHIHTDSRDGANKLDDLLWTFRDCSFIPHGIENQDPLRSPVTIGHGWVPDKCEVLINLAVEVPMFFSRFERVAEIVDQDQANRENGRQHYRFYRDRGYPLQHHEIGP